MFQKYLPILLDPILLITTESEIFIEKSLDFSQSDKNEISLQLPSCAKHRIFQIMRISDPILEE